MDRRIWNHPYRDQQLNLAVGGVNPMPYFDITMRSNNPPSSNISVEIPNHLAANPGPSHDLYMHASSASSSNRMPPNYAQLGPSCYNDFANGHTSITANPQMEYGRAPFKRKNLAVSMAVDGGNTNIYYTAGSSSNFPIPFSTLQPNPTPGPQYWAWDPVSMPLGHRSDNLSTVSEVSNRNVRSRQCNAPILETHPTGPHLFSNPSHHHPSTNVSGLTAAGQWSQPPSCLVSQRRVLSSGSGGFNLEMNQSLGGRSSVNHNMEIDIGYRHISVHSGSSSTPLPPLHGMPSQVMGVGHNGYGSGTTHNAIASYQPVGFVASLENGRQLGMEAIPPSRHSRPLSTVGRSNERNGRSRNLYDSLQPFSYGDSARSRWESEGASLMDRSIIYDSRNLVDQHRDMRLDIDNMSYEELLALEERIGYVTTGLSENSISVCLKESIYYSFNEDSEEGNCAICLEEYKDKDGLGRLDCGHDFHASCIKKWLLIKKVCPICKGAALPDSSEQK